MIQVVCQCGLPFDVPAAYAGRRVKCRGCGQAVPVSLPTPPSPAAPATTPTPIDMPDVAPGVTAAAKTEEPIAYGFLVVYAYVMAYGGPIAALVLLVIAFPDNRAPNMTGPEVIAGFVAPTFACVGSLVTSALCFVVVDIGRSLRAARPKA